MTIPATIALTRAALGVPIVLVVLVLIDRLLAERGMSVGDFAATVGITPANVAVLKRVTGPAQPASWWNLHRVKRTLVTKLTRRAERPPR